MKTKLFSGLITITFSIAVNAQITFDLADKKTKSESIDVGIEPILIIKNMLPDQSKHAYSFEIQKIDNEIPPLEVSWLASDDCNSAPDELQQAIRDLKNVAEENDVEDQIEKLNKIIKKLNKTQYAKCIALARKTISLTETPPKKLGFKIRYNQTITIKVTRVTEKKDTVFWTRVYKTPTKSPWSVMYGFTFIPNMMNPVNNYFSQVDTSGKLFIITKQNNQKNYFLKNVSPTIMITWKPLAKYFWIKGDPANNFKFFFSNNLYQFGMVGGLSLNFASDVTNANVLIAPSIIFSDNLSISLGVAATQKNVLKGQYKEGDVIKDNLDFSQLHDKTYMAEWFVSIAFRFSSNPFKKTDSSDDKSDSDK